MLNDNQTATKKIANLTNFLEKTKTSFYQNNNELHNWFHDRNLKIENLGQEIFKKNKTFATPTTSVEAKVIEKLNTEKINNRLLESEITQEEYEAIFQKLIDLLALPSGQLEDQSELYLEQQLSDILGFDIAAELENHRLIYSTGIISAEPHLKRYPNDVLENHSGIFEAGIDKFRSSFGWFTKHGNITPETEELEKYYFSLQLYNLENWNSEYKKLKQWYKFRKMIAINPTEKIAVVGVVGNINNQNPLKAQFGASPEIIREGKLWSPKSQGKVLIMFVDDPNNEVPLGPIYLNKLFKKN